jgi:Flp pilus assembly protein TadG
MFATKKNPCRASQRRVLRESRSGVATIEAAFCLPVIIILMFGTLEICSGYYLKESLEIAAYEGARFGARQNTEPQDVRDYVTQILADRNVTVTDSDITITPATFGNQRVLDPLTVSVSCSATGNSMFVFQILADRTLTGEVTYAFETGLPPTDLND